MRWDDYRGYGETHARTLTQTCALSGPVQEKQRRLSQQTQMHVHKRKSYVWQLRGWLRQQWRDEMQRFVRLCVRVCVCVCVCVHLNPKPPLPPVPSPNPDAPAACFSFKVSNINACGFSNVGLRTKKGTNGKGMTIEECRAACRKNSACTG